MNLPGPVEDFDTQTVDKVLYHLVHGSVRLYIQKRAASEICVSFSVAKRLESMVI